MIVGVSMSWRTKNHLPSGDTWALKEGMNDGIRVATCRRLPAFRSWTYAAGCSFPRSAIIKMRLPSGNQAPVRYLNPGVVSVRLSPGPVGGMKSDGCANVTPSTDLPSGKDREIWTSPADLSILDSSPDGRVLLTANSNPVEAKWCHART